MFIQKKYLIFILMLGVSCTSKIDYSENCTNENPNLSAAKDNWTAELEQTKTDTLNKMCNEEIKINISKEIEAQSCYLTVNQMQKSMENMQNVTQCN